MRTRLLATDGNGKFTETLWNKPNPSSNEISVKALMTGICRSDIDMMQGNFGPLPLHMQGHEGLAQVCEVGADVLNVKVGDIVATRGEPAYADYYNVRDKEFVVVPSAEPKYILEPVACGINIVQQPIREIAERSGPGKRLLLLGSGFLAWVAYHTILLNHLEFEIDVVGNSNLDIWQDKLKQYPQDCDYDVVIDLSGKYDVFSGVYNSNQSLLIVGVQKTVTTDFGSLLWKACTIVFPSPRTDGFYKCMQDAAYWIENGDIVVDNFWTSGYNRETQWQEAFEEGLNRPQFYSRGYIFWE